MNIFTFIIFIIFSIIPLFNSKVLKRRIINGLIADPGQFPWYVSIKIDNRYGCGATLISSRWILSAVHCVQNPDAKVSCYFGSTTRFRGIRIESESIIMPTDKKKDFCLIKLSKEVQFTDKIKPALLPEEWMTYPKILHKVTFLAGNGRYNMGEKRASDAVRYTQLEILKRAKCYIKRDDKICTITVNTNKTMNTCSGDSGGGLIFPYQGKNYVLGVLSYGIVLKRNKCSWKEKKSIFQSVVYDLKWIMKITGIEKK